MPESDGGSRGSKHSSNRSSKRSSRRSSRRPSRDLSDSSFGRRSPSSTTTKPRVWKEPAHVSGFSRRAHKLKISLARSRDRTTPYWLQCDAAMDEAENAAKRHALRDHPLVLDALGLWWETMARHLGAHPDECEVPEREYVRFSLRLYKAMINDWDEAEAAASARDDWEHDAQGRAAMGRTTFEGGLFELADVWAHDIDATEYAALLHQLFGCVSTGPAALATWREVDEIEYMGEWEHDPTRSHAPPAAFAPAPSAALAATSPEPFDGALPSDAWPVSPRTPAAAPRSEAPGPSGAPAVAAPAPAAAAPALAETARAGAPERSCSHRRVASRSCRSPPSLGGRQGDV